MKPLISIKDIWNESLIRTDRELVSRDYLWASQLSKPPIDIWLSMRGTKPTNLPDERAKRKFQSGNFFEHMVGMAMMRAGVMTEKQDEVWTRGDIHVKGKGDFILNGKFDFDKAVKDIHAMFLPSSMEEMFLTMCEKMRMQFEGLEFEPTVFEIKSVAERTMTRIEKAQKPLESHILQTAHYKLGRNLNDGVVAVLCRDDLRLFEYRITKGDQVDYYDKVNDLATILKSENEPYLEKEIVFDSVMGKFSKNLGIEYSNYLTMLYNYTHPNEYSDAVKPIIARFNRTLARIKKVESGEKNKPTKKFPDGAPIQLTEKNIAVVDEMNKMGFDAYKLSKVAEVEEIEEEETA